MVRVEGSSHFSGDDSSLSSPFTPISFFFNEKEVSASLTSFDSIQVCCNLRLQVEID